MWSPHGVTSDYLKFISGGQRLKVLNSFDSLKEAWAARKSELEGRVKAMGGAGLFGGGGMYGGGGGGMAYGGGQAQELARLEHVSVTCCLLLKSQKLIVGLILYCCAI